MVVDAIHITHAAVAVAAFVVAFVVGTIDVPNAVADVAGDGAGHNDRSLDIVGASSALYFESNESRTKKM